MRVKRIAVAAVSILFTACEMRSCAIPNPDAKGPSGFMMPAEIVLRPHFLTGASEWIAARASAVDSVGAIVGDSAARLRMWPTANMADSALSRACGTIATGRVPLGLADPLAFSGDTTAPLLGVRRIKTADVAGVRWIVPGVQAQYAFEGVTDDGRQRISFRWPVRADSSARIPVGAADSVIEAALSPSPDTLDAFMRRVAMSSRGTPTPAPPNLPKPRQADAVPLVSDLPFHVVMLPLACPTTTLRMSVLARTEQRIRIPVRAGDQIDAFASTEYGAVQASFDEVGPTAPSTGFANVPEARVIAAVDGTVTLRLSLQVVSKKQRADQDVLLRITRRGAR